MERERRGLKSSQEGGSKCYISYGTGREKIDESALQKKEERNQKLRREKAEELE